LKFRSLFINGFGVFDQSIPPEKRFFRFNPDKINVVTGKNERGKSTLMEAIIDTLYGIPPRRRHFRVPWGEHTEFSARLEFSIGERLFIINRDFADHKTSLDEIKNGEKAVLYRGKANPRGTGKSAREFRSLLEDLEIPSREILEKLAYVTKMEMDHGVTGEVRRIVTGGGKADYQSIIEELKDEYFKLTRIDPWKSRDKQRSRLIEDLVYEREELNVKYERSCDEHEKVVLIEEEIKKLEEEIKSLQDTIKDGKFLRKKLGDYIRVEEEHNRINMKLRELFQQKSRIQSKIKDLANLDRLIYGEFRIFVDFEEDVERLCIELEKTRENLEKIKSENRMIMDSIEKLRREKESIEKKLDEMYSDYREVNGSFLEDIADYFKLKKEVALDTEYYMEKKNTIEALKTEIRGKRRFKNKPDNYEQLLYICRAEEKQSKMEQKRLEFELKERENLEDTINNSKKALDENYTGFYELPENVEEKIRENIISRKNRDAKKSELRQTTERLKSANEKLKHPLNFIIPAGALLLFFIAGFLLKDVVMGIIAAFPGLALGCVIVWFRIRPLLKEKSKLEAIIEMQEKEIEEPLPDTGISDELIGPQKPAEFLRKYRAYLTTVERLENIRDRLSSFKTREEINNDIREIDERIDMRRKELGIGKDEDIEDILSDYSEYRQIKEKITTFYEVLKERFPDISVNEPLPELPEEIVEKMKRLGKMENQHPVLKKSDDLDKIKRDYFSSYELKINIREIETRISQIVTDDETEKEIIRLKNNENNLTRKLAGFIEKFGDNPDIIIEKNRRFIELQNDRKNLAGWISEVRSPEDLDREIYNLTAEGSILLKSKNDLLTEAPGLKSLTTNDAESAILKLKSIDTNIKESQSLLSEKKDLLNIRKYRLEQYGRNIEDPNLISEKLKTVNKKIDKITLLKDAYRTAVDLLDESVNRFYETYHQILGEKISLIFREMTGEKYQRVELGNDFELSLEVLPRKKVGKEYLSTGAIDQLFFAVRIALARELSDKVSLPFLLDDPFVFFDFARLSTARKILERISRKHQVILFSHNPEYSDWGVEVCNLDEISGQINLSIS